VGLPRQRSEGRLAEILVVVLVREGIFDRCEGFIPRRLPCSGEKTHYSSNSPTNFPIEEIKERTALRQRRQPPPEGAHVLPPPLADGPEVAKVENCCSVFLEPHLGHTGAGWFLLRTSFSNVFLHFWQVYSKIGIGNFHLQFLLSGASSRSDRTGG
jgi:hypothetical protein